MPRRAKHRWMHPVPGSSAWHLVTTGGSETLGSVREGNVIHEWVARSGERVLGRGSTRSLKEAKRSVERMHNLTGVKQ